MLGELLCSGGLPVQLHDVDDMLVLERSVTVGWAQAAARRGYAMTTIQVRQQPRRGGRA